MYIYVCVQYNYIHNTTHSTSELCILKLHFALSGYQVAPMPWDLHDCNAWPDKFTVAYKTKGSDHYN